MPLDVFISLSHGHIRTAEFKANLESHYSIALAMNTESDFERIPCPRGSGYCQLSVSLARVAWSLSKKGMVVATSNIEPDPPWSTRAVRMLGDFHLTPGSYVLDSDMREDQSRLNILKPSAAV